MGCLWAGNNSKEENGVVIMQTKMDAEKHDKAVSCGKRALIFQG